MSMYTNNDPPVENPLAGLPPAVACESVAAPDAEGGKESSPLARLITETAFSFVLPKLQAVFENIHQPGYSILNTLSRNINELQDAFTMTLYAKLSDLDIDFSSKLTLRLDNEGELRLVGNHPDGERITAMLSANGELSRAFAEIAAQSCALRDLRSLAVLMGGECAARSYRSLADMPGENTYQISLKGDMNHFYFIRA